jgi:HEAT repeat protein
VVGPATVGALIDALATAAIEARQQTTPEGAVARERYQELLGRITAARPSSLAGAVLARADTAVPQIIGMLAGLLAKQGHFDARVTPLLPEGDLRRALVSVLYRWVEVLLASAESTRYQLAEVAQALGRLGEPESVPALLRLLDEDLVRRRRALEEVRRAIVNMSDAHMSYVGQYGSPLSPSAARRRPPP